MPHDLPCRIIHDWDPQSPLTDQQWLEQERAAGWVPDPIYGPGSVPVDIDGRQLRRYAMVKAGAAT